MLIYRIDPKIMLKCQIEMPKANQKFLNKKSTNIVKILLKNARIMNVLEFQRM